MHFKAWTDNQSHKHSSIMVENVNNNEENMLAKL